MNQARNKPLEGIRAIELSEIWAGPFCGCLLGDMGAEVIKLESIQRIARGPLNPLINTPGYPDNDPGDTPWNRQGNFNSVNRNKLGLTLDLKTENGVNVFKDLVSTVDIVFCNYARTVMENFGLGYEVIKQIKPDIIFMLMPGYGNDGPYKNYRSMGMAIDAISGHSFLRGYPDIDQSSNSLVHHPDAVAAVNGLLALTTALIRRTKSGKGQFIDMSQAESFMTHLGEIYIENQINDEVRERRGNRHPNMIPSGVYRCSGDDNWIAISVRNETEWEKLCDLIDPCIMEDPQFLNKTLRLKNHDELDKIINKWTSSKTKEEVMNTLQDTGIPAGAVLDCGPEAYSDPQLNERNFFQIVDHPDAGIYPMSGPIFRFQSDKTEPKHMPSPCLGQHNDYILGELMGYSDHKISVLEKTEVIGNKPLTGSDMGGSRRFGQNNQDQKVD